MEEQAPKQNIEQPVGGNNAYNIAYPNPIDDVERARVMAEAGDISRTNAATTRKAADVMIKMYTAGNNGIGVLQKFKNEVGRAEEKAISDKEGSSDNPRKRRALNALENQSRNLNEYSDVASIKRGINDQKEFLDGFERQADMDEDAASKRFDEAAKMRQDLGIREPEQAHEYKFPQQDV